MKYMGSKSRIQKYIIPIQNEQLELKNYLNTIQQIKILKSYFKIGG